MNCPPFQDDSPSAMPKRKTPEEILRVDFNVLDHNASYPVKSPECFEWLATASVRELREIIKRTLPNTGWHTQASVELRLRLAEKHWTVLWGFIIAVLTMVFAGIAAWPVIRDWFQSAPPASKDASSPPPQSNSTPTTPPTSQKAQPATNAAQSTNH